MNGLAFALMGGDLDPDLIRLLTAQDKERRDRMDKLIANLGKNAVTGYRFLKGPPKVVDATTQKEIDPSDPRYAGLMAKYRAEQDGKFEMFENAVNSVVEIALEFSKPSAIEAELMARIMNRKPAADARVSADSARFK